MRIILITILSLWLLTAAAAQESASYLTLERITGSPVQGKLSWYDDDHLIVSTSAEISVVAPQQGQTALVTIPAGESYIVAEETLITGGQVWGIADGQARGTSDAVAYFTGEQPDQWAYWMQSFDAQRLEVHHSGQAFAIPLADGYSVSQVVFSPDGQYLALVLSRPDFFSRVDRVELWNLPAQQLIAELPQRLEFVDEVHFYQDSTRLLTASSTGAVYAAFWDDAAIWDTATGTRLNPDEYGYIGQVSPDNRWVAIRDYGNVFILGAEQIGMLATVRPCVECWGVSHFAFSPDSREIVTLTGLQLEFWNLDTLDRNQLPEVAARSLQVEGLQNIEQLLYAPDGQTIVLSGYQDHDTPRLMILDAITGETQFVVDGKWFYQLAFSPDGRIFRARAGTEIHIWSTASWGTAQVLPNYAVINPAWTQAAYWDQGEVVVISIPDQRMQKIAVIDDYRGQILATNPAGGWVAFRDAHLLVHDVQTDAILLDQPLTRETSVYAYPDSPYLITAWTVEERSQTVTYDMNHLQDAPRVLLLDVMSFNLRLTPDERYFSGYYRSFHEFMSAVDGSSIAYTPFVQQRILDQMITADGKYLFVLAEFTVLVVDLERDQLPVADDGYYLADGMLFGLRDRLYSVTVSPDRALIAVGGRGCEVHDSVECSIYHRQDLYRLQDSFAYREEYAQPIAQISDASFAVFSPDSQFVLTDQGIRSLDGSQIAGFSSEMGVFDPAGKWLVTVERDQVTLRDWQAVQQGETVVLDTLPVSDVQALYFDPAGEYLYIQRSGEVQVVRVQSPQ